MSRPGHKGDRLAVRRGGDLRQRKSALGDGLGPGRQRGGFFLLSVLGCGGLAFDGLVFSRFGFSCFSRRCNGDRAQQGRSHGLLQQHVSAVLFAPTDHIFPLDLPGLLLVVAQGRGHRVVKGNAIRRPGKGVHVELLSIKRQCLAAPGRDHPQAVGLGPVGLRFAAGIGGLAGQGAVGHKRDPLAIWAPLGVLFAAGVGQRAQPRLCGPKPKVVAEGPGFPVGTFGGNHRRRPVRRDAGLGDRGGVHKLVQCDGRLCGLGKSSGGQEAG